MDTALITVGELAQRVGLRPSALRYYEEQGLLVPTTHSEAGYRLYDAGAEQTLRFIVRAQRLGFSLADIRTLLHARQTDATDDSVLLSVAEARYLALERQITPLLVLRHELAHLLQDMRPTAQEARLPRLDSLIERVCTDPMRQSAETSLARLLELSSCRLTSEQGQEVLARLQGHHVHVWHTDGTYHVLVVGVDVTTRQALEHILSLEASCTAHTAPQPPPEIVDTDEGYLITVRGEDAFLYARLFMAIEDSYRM